MYYNKRKYYETLLRRVTLLEQLYLEGVQDDLRKHLGEGVFDMYMDARKKFPSEKEIDTVMYPDFSEEELLDDENNAKKRFAKKYSNLRKSNLITVVGGNLYSNYPLAANLESPRQIRQSLDDYNQMKNYVITSFDNFRQFNKVMKMDPSAVRKFASDYTSIRDTQQQIMDEGATEVYHDPLWTVYKVTTYKAAQKLGKGAKWCIAGNYEGHEERGEEYFYDYINDENLDGGYYFYLKSDGKTKYALLRAKDGAVHSIWNAADIKIEPQYILKEESDFPSINGIFNPPSPNAYDLYSDDYDKVKKAIADGQDLSQICDNKQLEYYGYTPLDWHMKCSHAGWAQLLINHGAAFTSKFAWKKLFYWDDYDLFKACVNNGLLDIVSLPIMFEHVLKNASTEWVKLLLSAGAKSKGKLDFLKEKLPSGKYPLQVELENKYFGGRVGVIRELIKRGADPNVTCEDGRTLLEVAIDENASPAVIKLLEQATGKSASTLSTSDKSQTELDRDRIEKALNRIFSSKDFSLNVYVDKKIKRGETIVVDLMSKSEHVNNGAHKMYAVSRSGSSMFSVSEINNGSIRASFGHIRTISGVADAIFNDFFGEE